MKLARLAGLTLLSILAASAVATSSTSAAPSRYYLGPLQTFTIHFSPLTILAQSPVATERCLAGGNGTGVAHPLPLNNFLSIVLKFTGCIAEERGEVCGTLKSSSPQGAEGEIITHTLRGLLGTLGGTQQDPVILIQAGTGTTLMTVAAPAGCETVFEAVTGNIIGLILLPLIGLRLDLHILFKDRPNILLANGLLDKYTLGTLGGPETWDTLALLLFEKDFELC